MRFASLCVREGDPRGLRTSKLEGRWSFTVFAVEGGLGSLDLESLKVYRCSLTDAGLVSVSPYHSRLRYTELRRCEHVAEDRLISLLERGSWLVTLEFGKISSTGEFFGELAKLRSRLHRIAISLPATNVEYGLLERHEIIREGKTSGLFKEIAEYGFISIYL